MFEEEDEASDADQDTTDVSDVEENDITDTEAGISTTESESEDAAAHDSLSDDQQSPDDPDSELVAFNAKLAQALGTRPGQQDLDSDESSSSDEDMNDDQMEAMDVHLEEVFRQRKKLATKKTEKKDARERIINFKCRVLELLEIYVKEQHSKSQSLSLLLPILKLIRKTRSTAVSDRACNVIRQYAKDCRGSRLPKLDDIQEAFSILEQVHLEVENEGPNAHAGACSLASLLLVRIIINHDRAHLHLVTILYDSTRDKTSSTRGHKAKASFFVPWQDYYDLARSQ